MRNSFSPTWFATFLDPIAASDTVREVEFIARHAPLPAFGRVLDICCGKGRHALALAARGYTVLGIDTDSAAISAACVSASAEPRAQFSLGDMGRLDEIDGTFDVAINMWHSFGYESDAANLGVVRSVAARVRPGGRCVFDVYNRDHIATFPAEETSERGGRIVHTSRSWTGNRCTVRLRYDNGPVSDEFEWRLYTPDEFGALLADGGFRTVVRCAWFDEAIPPSAEHGRMQFVAERGA